MLEGQHRGQTERVERVARDDEDIEAALLLREQQRTGHSSEVGQNGLISDAGHDAPLQRPPFPPPSVVMKPAFPSNLTLEETRDLVAIWGFLHSFSDALGLWPASLSETLAAFVEGSTNRLTTEMHVALLRLLQADIEDAHMANSVTVQTGFTDRAITAAAVSLDEAWAWGFDPAVWRAHLGPATWPEVLRQIAISLGWGPRRVRVRKDGGTVGGRSMVRIGREGEDVAATSAADGLTLRMPSRLHPSSVKGAAWQVLADTGPQGLTLQELTRRMQQNGLRDMAKSSRTPEASLGGVLARDAVFFKTAPATFALQAVVAFHRQTTIASSAAAHHPSAIPNGHRDSSAAPSEEPNAVKGQDQASAEAGLMGEKGKVSGDGEDDDEEEGDAEDGDALQTEESGSEGEPWVHALALGEYNDLPVRQRLTAMARLTDAAVEGVTLRTLLEARLDEVARVRRVAADDARAEKKHKQNQGAKRPQHAAGTARRTLNGSLRADSPACPASLQEPVAPVDTAETADAATSAPIIDDGGALLPRPAERADDASTQQRPREGVPASVQRKQRSPADDPMCPSEDAYLVRLEAVGQDRRHNRYWRMLAGTEGTSATARLFFESAQDGSFQLIADASSLKELMSNLLRQAAREGPLLAALSRCQPGLVAAMPAESLELPPPPKSLTEQQRSAASAEVAAWPPPLPTHAAMALHKRSAAELNPLVDSVVTGLKQQHNEGSASLLHLRVALTVVVAALPLGALQPWFSPAAWKDAVLEGDGNLPKLRTCLAALEAAILPARLAAGYLRYPACVRGAWLPTCGEIATSFPGPNGSLQLLPDRSDRPGRESATAATDSSPAVSATHQIPPHPPRSPLNWLPLSVPALSLRLAALDAAIIYFPGTPPGCETSSAYQSIQRPGLRSALDAAERVEDWLPCGGRSGGAGRASTSAPEQASKRGQLRWPPFPKIHGQPRSFRLPPGYGKASSWGGPAEAPQPFGPDLVVAAPIAPPKPTNAGKTKAVAAAAAKASAALLAPTVAKSGSAQPAAAADGNGSSHDPDLENSKLAASSSAPSEEAYDPEELPSEEEDEADGGDFQCLSEEEISD